MDKSKKYFFLLPQERILYLFIFFLHRTESHCVWSISMCLRETYLVVKSNFNGYFIQTLGRPAMSVGSTCIPPRQTNWTLLDVSTGQWADQATVCTAVVWVNENTLSCVIPSSCFVILTIPVDRCYFLSAEHRCHFTPQFVYTVITFHSSIYSNRDCIMHANNLFNSSWSSNFNFTWS